MSTTRTYTLSRCPNCDQNIRASRHTREECLEAQLEVLIKENRGLNLRIDQCYKLINSFRRELNKFIEG